MMKSRQLGLVITRQSNSWALRPLRNLGEALGPVKARSYRQASRVANSFRAGYPVHEYDELAVAKMIVICASDDEAPAIVGGLAASRLQWPRKSVLLCGRSPDSANLGELALRGASAGSVSLLDDGDELRYFIEGDPQAVRLGRRLVEGGGGRVIEIERSTQRICAAAVSFASWVMLPLVDASMRCLRLAGLTPTKAAPLIELAVTRALRAYLKGGRRAWKTPVSLADREAFLRQVESLRDRDPARARLLVESARLSIGSSGKKLDWLDSAEAGE